MELIINLLTKSRSKNDFLAKEYYYIYTLYIVVFPDHMFLTVLAPQNVRTVKNTTLILLVSESN